jgi:hypothetical protein
MTFMPEEGEVRGMMATVGVIIASIAVGYLVGPAWGWLSFGVLFTILAYLG